MPAGQPRLGADVYYTPGPHQALPPGVDLGGPFAAKVTKVYEGRGDLVDLIVFYPTRHPLAGASTRQMVPHGGADLEGPFWDWPAHV